MIPFALSELRVGARVQNGGQDVPAAKLGPRYERLWPLIAAATPCCYRAVFYNNAFDEGPPKSLRIVSASPTTNPYGPP
jgi:predicted ABC-type ATPase